MATCAVCGADNPDRARFCNECAAPLAAVAPHAVELFGRMEATARSAPTRARLEELAAV
jgi:hypothetical protein